MAPNRRRVQERSNIEEAGALPLILLSPPLAGPSEEWDTSNSAAGCETHSNIFLWSLEVSFILG